MRLYTKEDDIYINIPSNMINNIDEDNILLKEYIRNSTFYSPFINWIKAWHESSKHWLTKITFLYN